MSYWKLAVIIATAGVGNFAYGYLQEADKDLRKRKKHVEDELEKMDAMLMEYDRKIAEIKGELKGRSDVVNELNAGLKKAEAELKKKEEAGKKKQVVQEKPSNKKKKVTKVQKVTATVVKAVKKKVKKTKSSSRKKAA